MSEDETNPSEEKAGFLNRWSTRKRQDSFVKQTVATEDAAKSANPLNAEFVSEPASAATLVASSEGQTDIHNGNGIGVRGHEVDSRRVESSGANGASIESEDEQELALLSDEDMPALETLTAKSDLSDFFNKGVSAALRRAALRHVFSLPVYNIRDGLNDYDDDYTKFEPLGDTITSDMKWHKARKEREAAEAEERRLLAEREAEEAAEEEARGLEESEAVDSEAAEQEECGATDVEDDAEGDGGVEGLGDNKNDGIQAGIDAPGDGVLITDNNTKSEPTELNQPAELETNT